MKEEDEIKRTCGKTNPFSVPEGYFEDFTQRLMEKLPERGHIATVVEAKITAWQRVKPWLYMAAMFCGLIFGFRYLISDTEPNDSLSHSDSEMTMQESDSDDYLESIIDHAMMDDYTIYCYLTEAETDLY